MSGLALVRLVEEADGSLGVVGAAGHAPGAQDCRAGAVTPAQYSRFKHGDGLVAQEYGVALAEAYHREVHHRDGRRLRDEVVVTSSGFDVAPPAARALVDPFVATLRRLLGPRARVRTVVVRRTAPSDGDYATMGVEARAAALGAHDLRLDQGCAVRGAHVVALDDVRVTGVHERAMDAVLRAAGARDVDHLYVVDAHGLGADPTVESRLNAVAVRGIDDLVRLASSPGFVPNARVTRMLLDLPDAGLDRFVAEVPADVVRWFPEVGLHDRLTRLERYRVATERFRRLVGELV